MNNLRRLSFLSAVLLLCVSLLPTRVQADSIRVTKGDVESILDAFTTGGRIILLTNETAGFHAGLVDPPGDKGSIRPLPPWDGQHYCVSDWHVILLAYFDGGDQSFTYQDALNSLSEVEFSFTVDGELLSTTRTPIKRFLAPNQLGLEEAYGFQEGAIMEPSDLGVGQHNLETVVTDPWFGSERLSITFYVDDVGSPACN
jgi:hypothetical protein